MKKCKRSEVPVEYRRNIKKEILDGILVFIIGGGFTVSMMILMVLLS